MGNNYKVYGTEVRFDFCPICNKEKKGNPDFSVDLNTKKYYCHTTGKGGKVEDLENFEFDIEIAKTVAKETFKEKKNFREMVENSKNILENKSWMEYLNTRGISTSKISKVIRVSGNAMMIPITNGDEIIAIKYRTQDKKMWSEAGSSGDYFINWQNVNNFNNIIITEGEIDLLSVLDVGLNEVVSLPFGAKNIKCITQQINWLKQFKKIIIATDNDVAGMECKNSIIEHLKDIKEKLYEIDLEKHKDLNEVLVSDGKEALKKILNSSKQIFPTHETFFESSGHYYMYTSKGIVQCTDFILEITGYSNNIIKGIVDTDGRKKEFIVDKCDILSREGMIKNLGLWIVTTAKIPNFIYWLLQKNKDKFLEEINHFGIIDNKYYDLSSEVVCNKNDLKIKPLNEIENITQEDLNWLNENLIYMRSDPNQSLIGICWALGRLHNQEAYPLLEVAGTTSIGKTEYVEFISRILFGKKENTKSFTTLTNHQIRSISSCSNITPWIIDEVKIIGKNLKERAIELYSTIRAVYDNKTINQGNLSSKLTEFKLCTPLIISGETELSDVSVQNRMIAVRLTPHNKSDEKIFIQLKNTQILEKFGKCALEKRLEVGKISIKNEEIRRFLPDVKDERQLYNAGCILIGFKFLNMLLDIKEDIKVEFIKYLNKKFKQTYDTEQNFKLLLELVIESGEPFDTFYHKSEKGHYANFNMLYKAIAIEHQKTNSTLELLDMSTLKKQMKECGFITKLDVAKKMKRDNLLNETITRKVVIFKEDE